MLKKKTAMNKPGEKEGGEKKKAGERC